MKKIIRQCAIAITLIAISACGFHLRNDASLPIALQPIYIGGAAANSTLGGALRYQLTSAETKVTQHPTEANYQLLLLSEKKQQRIISLDRRGLAAEYGITSTVVFELHDKGGNRVLGPQTIEERRNVTNNPDNALTTSQDIGLIRTDMDQVLATQIVRRLGAFAKHPQTPQLSPPQPDTTPANDVPSAFPAQ